MFAHQNKNHTKMKLLKVQSNSKSNLQICLQGWWQGSTPKSTN